MAANGTLQPTRSVTIGSELSGTVRNVLVDVNDKVKKGQVLVELDTAKLEAQVLRSRASLAAAQAGWRRPWPPPTEAEAGAGACGKRAPVGRQVPSATELDAGRPRWTAPRPTRPVPVHRSMTPARPSLPTKPISRRHRSVRPSTVGAHPQCRARQRRGRIAASGDAVHRGGRPDRLRLDVSVDEADVGSLTVGQKASFTVSAYPSRRYPAEVTRVSFGSTKTDNVVTYITWLDVDNSDLSLRPGMTAAATITSTERNDVLLVPNTALRFTPAQRGGRRTAGKRASANRGIVSQLMPGPPRNASRKTAGAGPGAGQTRQIWLLQDGVPQPVSVKVGISDGRMTEVSAGAWSPARR